MNNPVNDLWAAIGKMFETPNLDKLEKVLDRWDAIDKKYEEKAKEGK
jgi:uncharacterized protein YfbU (UPF0304 family)